MRRYFDLGYVHTTNLLWNPILFAAWWFLSMCPSSVLTEIYRLIFLLCKISFHLIVCIIYFLGHWYSLLTFLLLYIYIFCFCVLGRFWYNGKYFLHICTQHIIIFFGAFVCVWCVFIYIYFVYCDIYPHQHLYTWYQSFDEIFRRK